MLVFDSLLLFRTLIFFSSTCLRLIPRIPPSRTIGFVRMPFRYFKFSNAIYVWTGHVFRTYRCCTCDTLFDRLIGVNVIVRKRERRYWVLFMVVKRNDWIRWSTIGSTGEDVINLSLGFLKYFLSFFLRMIVCVCNKGM